MRPEHLALLRTPGTPAPHPDGTWAALAVARPDPVADTYPSDLWRVDLASGALTRLTSGGSDGAPAISPDGRWLAFVRDRQLALMPTAGGEPVVLTEHPLGVRGVPVFSTDSTRIAYTAPVPEPGRYGTAEGVGPDAEPPRLIETFTYRLDGVGFTGDKAAQVFVIDVPAPVDPLADAPEPATAPARAGLPAPVQLTAGRLGHADPRWRGEDLLALRDVDDDFGSALVVVPTRPGGEPGAAPAVDAGALAINAVRVDGERLWVLLNDLGPDGTDFVGVFPALGTARLAGDAAAGWALADVELLTDPAVESLEAGCFEVAPGGVVLTRAHRGATQLVAWRGTGVEVLLGGDVVVQGGAPVPGTGIVVAAVARPASAGDVVLVGNGESRVLTDLSARLREHLVTPVELETTAPDGYPVHGWLAVPPGEGPHPVLLLIHGGPHAAYTPALFDEVQVYAGAGYAVAYCNPRGSASYGRAHGRAIIHGFGDRDAADVLAFLDAALADPRLDAGRVGVMGGSYGGYLTAWLTTVEHRWAGAIVERGYLDPVSFAGSSDIGYRFGHVYNGEDPALVAAQSPMAHLDAVTTPTLVIHSENDWRCPIEQGQRWYVGLRRAGVETKFLLFPGEGHELTRSGRPTHRIARFAHVLDWWRERFAPADKTKEA